MHHGFGSMLLKAALSALNADGYDQVYLWAIAENTNGLRFYQQHGFRATGERIAYTIGSSALTDIRMILSAQRD